MRIIFFGTDEFAASILDHLLNQSFEIVAVVTRPDKPQKRSSQLLPPAVKEMLLAKGYKGEICQPIKASSDDFVKHLAEYTPDLFVVVSYGQLLKQNILDLPKKGSINVHPSLLPKYRGASPMQSAVLAGEHEVGVCIMEMILAMDAGDILKMVKIPLGEDVTFGEIQKILCEVAKKALVEVLYDIQQEKNLIKIKQEEALATFTKKIETQDSFISWNDSSGQTHNFIRGMSPKPGARAYVEVNGEKKLLKIFRSKNLPLLGGKVGDILFFDKNNGFVVGCKKGAIQLLEVQLEGKKPMSAKDFISGFSLVKFI